MIQFDQPVKYLGNETKQGTSKATGKDFKVVEMKLFITDLGRVKIPVFGNPEFPPVGSSILLKLSVDQGRYQSLSVVYDESSQFAIQK